MYGLSDLQIKLLKILDDGKCHTSNDLANKTNLSIRKVASLLKPLVQDGSLIKEYSYLSGTEVSTYRWPLSLSELLKRAFSQDKNLFIYVKNYQIHCQMEEQMVEIKVKIDRLLENEKYLPAEALRAELDPLQKTFYSLFLRANSQVHLQALYEYCERMGWVKTKDKKRFKQEIATLPNVVDKEWKEPQAIEDLSAKSLT